MYPSFPLPSAPLPLFLDPVDPSFLLGAGPSWLGAYAGATYQVMAPQALALFGSTAAGGKGAARALDPVVGPGGGSAAIVWWPLLWGPGQRGVVMLRPQMRQAP